MGMHAREMKEETIRKWGRFFTERLRAEELGAMPMVFRHERRVVYRVLGIRMSYGTLQLPTNWRVRLKAAGLDSEWNVVNERLWEHAIWQVETTGVFRPERQAGILELVSDEAKPGEQVSVKPVTAPHSFSGGGNVPRGTNGLPSVGTKDGESTLSEILSRSLKR